MRTYLRYHEKTKLFALPADAEVQEFGEVFAMADQRIGDPRWDGCCGVLRRGGGEHRGASIVGRGEERGLKGGVRRN